MDLIASTLGRDSQWNGSADYLEEVANIIASTGRPHPGDQEPGTYEPALRAWASSDARGEQRSGDSRSLDQLAVDLAEAESWSSDDLQGVAETVVASGRPEFGDREDGEYDRALRRWQISQGLVLATVDDHLGSVSEEASLPVMEPILSTVRERGDVGTDVLMALSDEDVTRLYGQHVGPVASRLNDVLEALPVRVTMPADYTFTRDEALNQIDDVRYADKDTSAQITADLLTIAYDRGALSDKALWSTEAAAAPVLYDRVVGPMVDELETAMAGPEAPAE